MTIFHRTADIVAANVNDLIDRFEDPERMLRQALREIESLVANTSTSVARAIAAEKLLAKTAAEQSAAAERWRERAQCAIDRGDDGLARRAIARKLDHERSASAAEEQLAAAREANATLRRQLDTLRERHASARSRLMLITARQLAAGARRDLATARGAASSPARALARFEHFYERLELAQAEAAAIVDLSPLGEADLDAEFERQAIDDAIDAEFALLKEQSSAKETTQGP